MTLPETAVTVIVPETSTLTPIRPGEDREEAAIQRHFQRPHHDRENRKPGIPLDRLPALPAGQGHAHGHPVPHQGAVHGASEVGLFGGLEDCLCDQVILDG